MYDVAIANVLRPFGYELTREDKCKMFLFIIFFQKKLHSKIQSFLFVVSVMGRTGPEGADILIRKHSLPITVDQYLTIIDEEYKIVFAGDIEILPGAERLIRHLHQNQIPIAVATSSTKLAFDLKISHHKDLFKLFDHFVIAPEEPEIKRGKPDPKTFLIAAERFKTPPTDMSKVLVLEDSVAGIQAANNAGMLSVWVPDSRTPKNLASPTLILNSLQEIRPEFFGLPSFD